MLCGTYRRNIYILVYEPVFKNYFLYSPDQRGYCPKSLQTVHYHLLLVFDPRQSLGWPLLHGLPAMCTDGIGGLPWMDAPNPSGMRRKTYRLNRAQGETTTRIRVGHIIPLCVTTNHFKTCLWPIMFALTQAWPRIVHRVCTRSFSPHLFLTYWEWMKTFFQCQRSKSDNVPQPLLLPSTLIFTYCYGGIISSDDGCARNLSRMFSEWFRGNKFRRGPLILIDPKANVGPLSITWATFHVLLARNLPYSFSLIS